MHATFAYQIDVPQKKDYTEIVSVWEAAVRATHNFLREEDIQLFRKLIYEKFLDAVSLHCVRDSGRIAGFLGTSDEKIEMLFVHPEFHGRGIGKQLLHFAIQVLNKKLVDVNEQNEQAIQFYKHCGFVVTSRSEKDGLGKPYPILHMELEK